MRIYHISFVGWAVPTSSELLHLHDIANDGGHGPPYLDVVTTCDLKSYLIFKVEIATSARIILIIQKRTMIFGSATPFSSKW